MCTYAIFSLDVFQECQKKDNVVSEQIDEIDFVCHWTVKIVSMYSI